MCLFKCKVHINSNCFSTHKWLKDDRISATSVRGLAPVQREFPSLKCKHGSQTEKKAVATDV